MAESFKAFDITDERGQSSAARKLFASDDALAKAAHHFTVVKIKKKNRKYLNNALLAAFPILDLLNVGLDVGKMIN